MFARIFLLPLLAISLTGFSNVPDSACYTSDTEKILFSKLASSQVIDTFDLFMAIGDKVNTGFSKEIQSFTDELKIKTAGIPVSKKIKTLYKAIHDRFLNKYTEESYFYEIPENGNYNCVSATALYALILHRLNVDYIIKETPNHVYLIADPKNTAFVMESTLPGEKILQYDSRYKSNYIEYLHRNKIISDNEFRNTSTDVLFEKHYLTDKTITLKQLAGLQYSNKGVFQYNKALYADSRISFTKAYFLYQSDLIKFMLDNSLINCLNLENQKKTYKGTTLALYMTLNEKNQQGLEYGKDYFNVVSSEWVINHPNISSYKTYYKEVLDYCPKIDTGDIGRMYYFFLGYHSSVNYEYSDALNHLGKAFEINPDNIATKQLFIETLKKQLVSEKAGLEAMDTLLVLVDKYPFLGKDYEIIYFLVHAWSEKVYEVFMSENYEKGINVLKQYESFLIRYHSTDDKNVLIDLYRKIGYSYLSERENDKAEQILRRGIRKIPDSEDLKNNLRLIMNTRGGSYEYPELMDDSKPLKKYLLALSTAKDNMDEINHYVNENLSGNWKLYNETFAIDTLEIQFLADNNLKFSDGNKSGKGTWNYNNSKCLMELSFNEDRIFHIILTGLGPKAVKGIVYEGNDYAKAKEVAITK